MPSAHKRKNSSENLEGKHKHHSHRRRQDEEDDHPDSEEEKDLPTLNTESGEFHRALDDLEDTLQRLSKDTKHSVLFLTGYGVYREIYNISVAKHRTIPESKLTEILRATKNIVAGNEVHPGGEEGYRKELDSYHHLSNQIRQFPWGKLIASAMLTLIGAAIVAASGIVAAASFGLLTPISAFGVELGASMVAGGIATGAGLLGAAMTMGGGMLFFNAVQTNPLRSEMKELEHAASEHYGFR